MYNTDMMTQDSSPPFVIPQVALAAFCRRWEITELALFGSALRADFGAASDIDMLVTFGPDERWTLFDFVRMQDELTELLGCQVDLVERRAVDRSHNSIRRKTILESARVIYAT